MPKKKKSQKRPTLLIISMCILALILVGVFIFIYGSTMMNTENDFLRIDKSIKDKSVKDTITYVLPSGWTEDTEASYLKETEAVLLKSGDYKEPTTITSADGNGISMLVNVSPRYRFQTLSSQKWDLKGSGFSNFTDISIDGISGIKYELIHSEDYFLQYFLIKDRYTLQMNIANSNHTDIEDKYWNDINSVINSIQFK
jgi:hypothetical protein